MGRELKRVPVDFDWPLDMTWEGFLNPYHADKCPACDGSYYAPRAKFIHDQWYGNAPFDPVAYGAKPLTIDHPAVQALARRHCERNAGFYGTGENAVRSEADRLWRLWRYQWCHHLIQADVDALVAAERLWDFTRVPINDEQREIVRKKIAGGGNSWLPESNGRVPTADEVNNWSFGGFGHDGTNSWVCLKARCAREGVPVECAACEGTGQSWSSPELKKAHDDWKETLPPTGEGWQMWETVSEGSPVTPVFATAEGLIDYLASPAAGRERTSRENAAKFVLGPGWTPSMIVVEGGPAAGLYSNLETMALKKEDPKESQ